MDALDLTLPERTHSSSAGLIRTQAWFSSGLNLAIVVFCLAIPDFPFDKRLLWVLAAYSLGYAAIAMTVERVSPHVLRHFISLSTCAGVIGLAPIVHWSGGITSPFAVFYLVFLVSELVYGGGGRLSMGCAIVSYFGVTLAEAGGLIPVSSDLAARIYASPLTTFWILASYTAFIVICATLTRIILAKLRRDVEREFHAKEGLLKQLADLDSCSQIGVLAHRVAHDLNSPIASALGSLDLMLMDAGSVGEADREGLETARTSLLHMAALVKGISGYGRAQEDRGSKIQLGDFFSELAALVKFHPSSAGGRFLFDKESMAGLSVHGSLKELRQVFFNLIKNGFEASAGLRHREVRVRAAARPGGIVAVTVTDSGPGIPGYERERMFLDRFTTKKDGTGVGLLIVGELVKKNGGSISAANLRQGGAEFSVALPLFTEKQ
ncbi:MAG: HAMP domain-containing sensor histidine kinase [Elusimicrobiales bacterium]|nr:HAMP domain-containing sensor histidine kinase [Elusimicrobiales bacterium]